MLKPSSLLKCAVFSVTHIEDYKPLFSKHITSTIYLRRRCIDYPHNNLIWALIYSWNSWVAYTSVDPGFAIGNWVVSFSNSGIRKRFHISQARHNTILTLLVLRLHRQVQFYCLPLIWVACHYLLHNTLVSKYILTKNKIKYSPAWIGNTCVFKSVLKAKCQT